MVDTAGTKLDWLITRRALVPAWLRRVTDETGDDSALPSLEAIRSMDTHFIAMLSNELGCESYCSAFSDTPDSMTMALLQVTDGIPPALHIFHLSAPVASRGAPSGIHLSRSSQACFHKGAWGWALASKLLTKDYSHDWGLLFCTLSSESKHLSALLEKHAQPEDALYVTWKISKSSKIPVFALSEALP
jgi:hypothetical protein